MELVLKNQPEELPRLRRALADFAREHAAPEQAVQAADLALEEHLTNVLAYAYTDKAAHDIRISLAIEGRCLQIEVADDGRPFNPLSHPAPDTSLPLDQRPRGGLGIHLIRQFMDELDYRREADRNILRMRKRLERGA